MSSRTKKNTWTLILKVIITVATAVADLASHLARKLPADAPLPLAQKRNVGLVLATRAWELAVFAALRRRRGDGGTVQDR